MIFKDKVTNYNFYFCLASGTKIVVHLMGSDYTKYLLTKINPLEVLLVNNFCSTCLPLAITGWVQSTLTLLHCPLFGRAQSINLVWKSRIISLECPESNLGPSLCEAQTLPLCYAPPPIYFTVNLTLPLKVIALASFSYEWMSSY